MQSGRAGFRLLLLTTGAAAWAGIFLLILGFTTRPVEVVVRSAPARASVFEGGRYIGETPVHIFVGRGERRVLRLLRKDHRETYLELEGDRFAPRGFSRRLAHLLYGSEPPTIMVEMPSSLAASLWVLTEPDGAEVYIDGLRAGVSPLRRSDLSPGAHAVRVLLEEYFPQEKTIALKPGETVTVRFSLESRWEALYRERIARDPQVMTNYAELAHSYVLRGRFDDAERVLRQGFRVLEERRGKEPHRFINELWQIYTHYYLYPREGADESLRPACRKMMETALEKELYPRKVLERFLKQMASFDRSYRSRRKP